MRRARGVFGSFAGHHRLYMAKRIGAPYPLWVKSGHGLARRRCPLCAKSGHWNSAAYASRGPGSRGRRSHRHHRRRHRKQGGRVNRTEPRGEASHFRPHVDIQSPMGAGALLRPTHARLCYEAAMPTIALVDDDRNILTSVSIALEAEGYRITTYTDG